MNAEPVQISGNRLRIFLARALLIGIIKAQHKTPARALGKEPVEEGRARIANMDAASGGGSKSDDRSFHALVLNQFGTEVS